MMAENRVVWKKLQKASADHTVFSIFETKSGSLVLPVQHAQMRVYLFKETMIQNEFIEVRSR